MRGTLTPAMLEALDELGLDRPVDRAAEALEAGYEATYAVGSMYDDTPRSINPVLMKCSHCGAVHKRSVECDCEQRPVHGPPSPGMTPDRFVRTYFGGWQIDSRTWSAPNGRTQQSAIAQFNAAIDRAIDRMSTSIIDEMLYGGARRPQAHLFVDDRASITPIQGQQPDIVVIDDVKNDWDDDDQAAVAAWYQRQVEEGRVLSGGFRVPILKPVMNPTEPAANRAMRRLFRRQHR